MLESYIRGALLEFVRQLIERVLHGLEEREDLVPVVRAAMRIA